jgi:hypothetical protein
MGFFESVGNIFLAILLNQKRQPVKIPSEAP